MAYAKATSWNFLCAVSLPSEGALSVMDCQNVESEGREESAKPGCHFSAALRYAVLTWSAVADLPMSRTAYGSMELGGSSTVRSSVLCFEGIVNASEWMSRWWRMRTRGTACLAVGVDKWVSSEAGDASNQRTDTRDVTRQAPSKSLPTQQPSQRRAPFPPPYPPRKMSTQQAPSAPSSHLTYLRLALSQAQHSPPKPTNFRVGAVLLDPSSSRVLATGYTLELPGNTHAEQVCLLKLAAAHNLPEERVVEALPGGGAVLYTTMEPCVKRLSGNVSCVERILRTRGGRERVEGRMEALGEARPGIKAVYVGVREPETFVGVNEGRRMLEDAGIEVVHVGGLEEEILRVATEGHKKENEGEGKDG